MLLKRSVRLTERTVKDLARIAQEKGCTETMVLENAVKYYSDYLYMQERATIIPQEIIRTLQASVALMEQHVNNKTNQVLSALAIETGTMEQIIASSLDLKPDEVRKYRAKSVDFLKANQRVFRLDEALD